MALWIYPSSDIHLVQAPAAATPPPATADVRVMLQFPKGLNGQWTDASTIGGAITNFAQLAPGAAAPGAHHAIARLVGDDTRAPGHPELPPPSQVATIQRSATVGTSYHLAVFLNPTQATSREDGILRVSTHDDIARLDLGDRTLSAFAGESDRVVTVYAQFSDRPAGVLEDVTAHPWLHYDVAPADVATVDAEGRVHALRAGQATITVTTWDARFPVELALTVRPALATGSLVNTVKVEELTRRSADRTTTVYVLAEGYDDERRFFDHARKVVKSWLATRPYKRVANRFHAIGIYHPSIDRGITIGSRLVPAPAGSPAGQRGVWEGEHSPTVPREIALARDTVFGLMMGTRLSTPIAGGAVAPARVEATFLAPRAEARVIQPDDRRLRRFGVDGAETFEPISPELGFASLVRRYLEAAGQTVGPNDRVAFLVDDDVYGGLHIDVLGIPLQHFPMVAVSVGRTPLAGSVLGAGPLVDRTVTGPALHADEVGTVFAHELAHSYHLGDEYENKRQRTYTIDDDNLHLLEHSYENIQHDRTLRLPLTDPNPLHADPPGVPHASRLDVTRIKWNVHRIAKISPATSIAPAATGFRLALAPGQAKRWQPGERAFIRNSFAMRKHVWLEPRTVAIAIQVVATDVVHDTVDLRVAAGTDVTTVGDRPLLYVPKRNGHGDELGLIDPVVLAFLAANGPFPKGRPCVGPADPNLDNEDRACPPITGFSRPSNNADALGLYEGGADQSCDVYRPSGRCKMRKFAGVEIESTTGRAVKYKPISINFCFVCSYILVDLIDPSQHEGLDRDDYPRDC